MSSAANPFIHSSEVLQPNTGHIQTVTVVKAKISHGLENNEVSMGGLGCKKGSRNDIIIIQKNHVKKLNQALWPCTPETRDL